MTRKPRLVALGAIGALVLAGIAVAYFTAGGSGSGTASVGTSSTITITGSTSSTLYPGSSEAVALKLTNPASFQQKLGKISLSSVAGCSIAWVGNVCNGGSAGVGDLACSSVDPGNASNALASNFYMADVTENQLLAASASNVDATNNGTLYMNDLSSNQDACKSAHLLLSFTGTTTSGS
jgi:hypothetical protein